jgi:hypothetical protein
METVLTHIVRLKARHTSSRQPYGIKSLRVKRDPRYSDFGCHHMLETESSNYRILT